VTSTLRERRNRPWYSAWRSAIARAAVSSVLLVPASCATPSSSTEANESAGAGPARLSVGVTEAQAREGRTSSFVLESTPDLALHATLRDSTYEGKTLLIRGLDPHGAVVWSYPHLQKGGSFDAILPVFGSPAARKHTTGSYSFEVLAPDHAVVAAGSATFISSRGSTGDAGGALYRAGSPATNAVAAAVRE
jgi:hypothetical protein